MKTTQQPIFCKNNFRVYPCECAGILFLPKNKVKMRKYWSVSESEKLLKWVQRRKFSRVSSFSSDVRKKSLLFLTLPSPFHSISHSLITLKLILSIEYGLFFLFKQLIALLTRKYAEITMTQTLSWSTNLPRWDTLDNPFCPYLQSLKAEKHQTLDECRILKV